MYLINIQQISLSCARNWKYHFFPSDYEFDDGDYKFYEVGDVIASVQKSVDAFYTLNEISVDFFGYVHITGDTKDHEKIVGNASTIVKPLLTVYYSNATHKAYYDPARLVKSIYKNLMSFSS